MPSESHTSFMNYAGHSGKPICKWTWTLLIGISLSLLLTIVFGSCNQPEGVTECLTPISRQSWKKGQQPWIHIQVKDSLKAYKIYAVIRHSLQFKYDNLLLRYGYIAPGDSVKYREVNLPLAAEGKWIGDTLGSVVETRIKLLPRSQRLPVGDNVFVMEHLMPDEPLKGILQVGIRIEAASNSSHPATSTAIKPDTAIQQGR